MNPKLIIADVLVLEKLHEALGELKLGTMPTILTMINRKTGYSLVSCSKMLLEDEY